jgi:4-amino-4-deoxy-L-arabinose transferase-like glycosyltransferase
MGIFVVGFSLRLVYVLSVSYEPYSDMLYYVDAATRIANGEAFPATYSLGEQYPAYIYFLGGLLFFFDHSLVWVRVCQAFLSSVTGVVTYYWARRLLGDRRYGLCAGYCVALYPDLILHSGTILTETLYTFLLSLVLLTWQTALDTDSKKWRFLVGAVMGGALLTRSLVLFFIPLGILWEWVRAWPNWVSSLRSSLIIGFACLLVCLPWFLRNQNAYGTFFPPSHQMALGLWGGNNSRATGAWVEHPGSEEQRREMAVLSVPEQRQYALRQAIKWIKENPIQFTALGLVKVSRLIGLKPDSVYKGNFYGKYPEALVPVVAKAFLWLFAVIGGVFAFSIRGRVMLIYLLFLSHLAVTTLFYNFARYLVPLLPGLLILVSYGVQCCKHNWKRYLQGEFKMDRSLRVVCLALCLLFLNWGWDIHRNVETFRAWKAVDSLKGLQMQSLEKIRSKPEK